MKFGQIQFLILDSVSPIKILGKIHPGFKTFKLAQKSGRKRPAVQISKSGTKSEHHFNMMNFFLYDEWGDFFQVFRVGRWNPMSKIESDQIFTCQIFKSGQI